MIILQNILSQEIIQRLGWTLLHFIWQATAVVLTLAILLRLLRKSTANLRYIIACFALALIVLLPLITIQLVPVSTPHPAIDVTPPPIPTVMPIVEMPTPETIVVAKPSQPESVNVAPAVSLKQRITDTFEPSLPYIVSGWLIGVFGLSIWHLGGWTQLQRLKRRMVKQVDSALQGKLKVLCQKLKVKQTVQLMESALVQIPTVVGWLRPVILLPVSALTGLNTEQLEAIIAHELAHIKRFDYLINILQTIVEILGFYHPAVWWVSYKIRAERENCCDDMAVGISGDRVSYAGALASMEEIRTGHGKLAVAAGGGNLFRRICRLLGKDSTDSTGLSWIPAVTVILLIIALAIPTTLALTARAQEKPEDLSSAVIKGIRENRDKFECGYLAWSSKQINNRFADSDHPAPELAGQYELWWDGKKIATKYVRDQVYKDPEGRYRIEEQQGGTSYDGGVLSRKPDFHSDNWLGPNITRWRGQGSQDWLIWQDIKQEEISKDWSVIDNNGVKLIRVIARNMNEKARDYGAYSIRDYDSSKGYGLVNEEWYNPDGSPRLKHTVKMLEIISGGWFPVEVDFKSFNITDGRVYTHSHYALDIGRCSFNDRSALPKGIFKLGMEKQLKYQEELQKYLVMELEGLPDAKEATKANKVKFGAREAIEKFIAASIAGDLEKAGEYAHPYKLPAKQIADITEIAKGQKLWIMTVIADDSSAIAVSSVIQGDHDRIGPLVFSLDRVTLDGRNNWWIHDIDIKTPDGAEGELKQFLEKHPEAEKIQSAAHDEDDIQNLYGNSEEKCENQIETQRVLSAQKLKQLGLAVAMYADDHDDNLPESIQKLRPYIRDRQDFNWLNNNVEYVLKETTYQPNRRNIPVAYDKTLNDQQSGTNVLFLDGHVEFVTAQRLSELDLKRAEFLINTWFLAVNEDFLQNLNHNASSPDEAEELLKLKSELLTAINGDNKLSFIPAERDINLLIKAVQAHKDSKILAEPHVLTREGTTTEINVMNNETYYIVGYTEPNDPSKKPKPILKKAEEGITLSLRPKLTEDKNIDMQFESTISRFIDFEERKLKGEGPKVERRTQTSRYVAKDGQILLLGGNKIEDRQDGQTVQKDLLILVKAQMVGPSELDKPTQADKPAVVEAPSSTTKVITPQATAKSKTERYKDDEQEKTKTDETVTEIFELRHGEPVEIVELLKKLINGRPENGAIIEQGKEPIVLIPEPRRKWIIAKASAENIQQIGQWIKKLDTDKTIGMDPIDAAVYERLETIVDLSNLSPGMSFAEVIEMLENSVEPPLQIQPIWKDLLENAEVEQATPAGMDPLPYIKLRKALEILLASVTTSQLGESAKPTYIVDDGVIVIGTAGMLPQKMVHRVYDISDLAETAADADDLIRRIMEKTAPDSWYGLNNKGQGTIIAYPIQQPRNFAVMQSYDIQQQIERYLNNMRQTKELPSQTLPKIPKHLLEKPEEPATPLERVQKQLDELIKQQQAHKVMEPNIPSAPKVRLISSTFVDDTLINALQTIARLGRVTIIPDETVKGLVSCTLKDVTVEKALDIVLVGTPYNWKKTPNYYLVFPEPFIERARLESALKLYELRKVLRIYANNHDGKYPKSLFTLSDYLKLKLADFSRISTNVAYLGAGTTTADSPDTVLAYDTKLMTKEKRTNVLFNDGHVSFENIEKLKKLRIGSRDIMVSREIMIKTQLWEVSEDFLKAVGLNGNIENFSDAWRGHLAATYPAGPDGQTYGLMIDDLHVNFLLRALGVHEDAHIISSPQVLCMEGKSAQINIMTDEYYYKNYKEPNNLTNEKEPNVEKIKIGTRIWLIPKMTEINRNVKLDFKLEHTQLEGIIESSYKNKYPIYKPIVDVISMNLPCTIPDGKTMLIGGLKITEYIKKEPNAFIGEMFKRGLIRNDKMLLILIKPIINPQQKATKVLPGKEDSEEDIRRLAEQLDKKIKSPVN